MVHVFIRNDPLPTTDCVCMHAYASIETILYHTDLQCYHYWDVVKTFIYITIVAMHGKNYSTMSIIAVVVL